MYRCSDGPAIEPLSLDLDDANCASASARSDVRSVADKVAKHPTRAAATREAEQREVVKPAHADVVDVASPEQPPSVPPGAYSLVAEQLLFPINPKTLRPPPKPRVVKPEAVQPRCSVPGAAIAAHAARPRLQQSSRLPPSVEDPPARSRDTPSAPASDDSEVTRVFRPNLDELRSTARGRVRASAQAPSSSPSDSPPAAARSDDAEVTRVFRPNLDVIEPRRGKKPVSNELAALRKKLVAGSARLEAKHVDRSPASDCPPRQAAYCRPHAPPPNHEPPRGLDDVDRRPRVVLGPTNAANAPIQAGASSTEAKHGADWFRRVPDPRLVLVALMVVALGTAIAVSPLISSRAAKVAHALGGRLFGTGSHRSRAAALPSVPAAPAPIRVNISVNPPQSGLFLDGEPVSNPLEVQRRPDRMVHTLRAEAPGYRTVVRFVRFERDSVIVIDLGSPIAQTQKDPAPQATGTVELPADLLRPTTVH